VVGQDVTAYTAYANYKFEGFDILGEYFNGDLDAAEDAAGYSLRVAYKFDKFEPVFRYSHLKNDTFVIDADELIRRAPEGDRPDPLDNLSNATGGDNEIDSYYFGFNYYYNKAVSLMVGYEIAETDSNTGDEVEIDGLRGRLQVLW
jgi:predicted porin